MSPIPAPTYFATIMPVSVLSQSALRRVGTVVLPLALLWGGIWWANALP